MRRIHQFGLILALALASRAAPAQTIDDSSRSAARALVNEGAAEFNAGQFEPALKKFNEAFDVAKVPTVAVWAAQANEKLGRLVTAAELYEQALLMQPNNLWVGATQEEAQQKARAALAQLKPRIPAVTIEIAGATGTAVEVTIDQVKVPNSLLQLERPVDPGLHEIVAKQGNKIATRKVTFAESQKRVITLQLVERPGAMLPPGPVPGNSQPAPLRRDTPDSKAKRQRMFGSVGIGVGAAGVAFGATTGIIVGLKRSSLHDDGCLGNTCLGPTYKSRVDSYNALRTLSTVGFVVGGVATAAGVALLLTSPKQESSAKLGLMVSPGAVHLAGDF